MLTDNIKALTFDVFGTVVDYYSSIVSEGEQLAQQKGLQVDWGAFALSWRNHYNPFIQRVERHELPWTRLDTLHRLALEEVLTEFHITNLTEEEKVHLTVSGTASSPGRTQSPDSQSSARNLCLPPSPTAMLRC